MKGTDRAPVVQANHTPIKIQICTHLWVGLG
jgi:hypothetical protein